ncbi:hypothetical protein AXYL_04063 [Achromobacter xylosoxidans A8]|uniref:DUF4145 domain-containing protein n=1 Tax=Achromobacter xylosoxidans (strain A8) TaxID=762376 RepID=E3HTU3_ACHXA|nr:hypothetical protein [Achromobacter xylosoxidans]ADP17383.1 hypothetical protein AXYL_04063 [Achromobacter xylosoxidans A8]
MDLDKLDLQYNVLVRAAETDDELGTVLRLHLLAEAFLEVTRDVLLPSDVKQFAPIPRNFSDKLGYAAVAGLPVPLVAVMHHINKMRNKLAHRDETGIDEGDLKQLGRLVNGLRAVVDSGSGWKPIEEGFLELPNKFPGERWAFGGGNLRADFVMCFGKFWFTAISWLSTVDLTTRPRDTA